MLFASAVIEIFWPSNGEAARRKLVAAHEWRSTPEGQAIAEGLNHICGRGEKADRLVDQAYHACDKRQRASLSRGLKSLVQWGQAAETGASDPDKILQTTKGIYADLTSAGLFRRWRSELSQTITSYVEDTKNKACIAFAKNSFSWQLVRGWFDRDSVHSIHQALSWVQRGVEILDPRLRTAQIKALMRPGVQEQGRQTPDEPMEYVSYRETRRIMGGEEGTIALKSYSANETALITTDMLDSLDVDRITDLEQAYCQYTTASGGFEDVQIIGLVKGDVALKNSAGMVQAPVSRGDGFVIVYQEGKGYSAIDPDRLVARSIRIPPRTSDDSFVSVNPTISLDDIAVLDIRELQNAKALKEAKELQRETAARMKQPVRPRAAVSYPVGSTPRPRELSISAF